MRSNKFICYYRLHLNILKTEKILGQKELGENITIMGQKILHVHGTSFQRNSSTYSLFHGLNMFNFLFGKVHAAKPQDETNGSAVRETTGTILRKRSSSAFPVALRSSLIVSEMFLDVQTTSVVELAARQGDHSPN